MLLAMDVGNSRIQWGVYDGDQLRFHWYTATDRLATEDEYALLLRRLLEARGLSLRDIDRVAIASVVPPLMPTLRRLSEEHLGVPPFVVGPNVKMGMPIRYENPREVGADRMVVAVGAYEKYGGPVVVVDFGTPLVFDVVSARGEYLGGAVAPGVEISTEALFQRAAKLPRIELQAPASAIATNTVHAMQSGIVYGFAGQVDAIVGRIKEELGGPVRIVATGEMAPLIAPHAKQVDRLDPLLPLEGLRIIFLRNHPA